MDGARLSVVVQPATAAEKTSSQIIQGHCVKCIAVLQGFSDGCLATGSQDGTICVWSPQGECEATVKYNEGVLCITALPDGRFMTGSVLGKLGIWSSRGHGECGWAAEQMAEHHSGGLHAITVMSDQRVATVGVDKKLCICDSESAACVQVLRGHTRPVLCLTELQNGRLVSGGQDKTVRLWDLHSGCEGVLTGHSRWVTCVVELLNRHFATGSLDCSIRIWSQVRSVRMACAIPWCDCSIRSSESALVVQEGLCSQILQGHTDGVEVKLVF